MPVQKRSGNLLNTPRIYIDILSSIDRLFRCLTTLQCGLTRKTLEAGIETRPTLRQTFYHTSQPASEPRQLGNYKALNCSFRLFTFLSYGIPVLNSFEELCIIRVAVVNSFTRVLNPRGGGVYIIINRQNVSLYHKTSGWPHTHTHTHTHIYIYMFVCMYVYVCVSVCVCVCVYLKYNNGKSFFGKTINK